MSKYELLIFDLDGTLLNTIDDLSNSCNEVLETLNLPTHKIEDYKLMVGNGAKNLITSAMPTSHHSGIEINHALNLFKKIYKRRNGENNSPYPDIDTFLKKISSTEYKTAVLSNKPQENVEDCIAEYFPDIRFDIISGAKDEIPLKPAPDSIIKIIKELNCNKEKTVIIGDSDVDIKTAINAEIDCIAVNWGFRPREMLEKFNVPIVENVSELESILFSE